MKQLYKKYYLEFKKWQEQTAKITLVNIKFFMNARKNLNKAETNNLNDTAKVF